MRRQLALVVLTLTATLATSRGLIGAQTPRDGAAAFKAAQQLEEVQGDLKGAIEAYKKIAAGNDKALAAKALLRMADCYQKLGDAQASQVYEQLIRDYSQQPEAAEARARLIAMRPVGSQAIAKRDWVAWTTQSWPIAVSSDGRFVAVDQGDLAIHDLGTGADQIVMKAPKGESPDDEASFSRNGEQLAYTWWKGQYEEVQVVNLHGPSTPRVLLNGNDEDKTDWSLAGWTTDGQAIAVVTYGKALVRIQLVGARDGSVRTLASLKRPISVDRACLSGDDKYIALGVLAADGSPDRLSVISTTSSDEVPVVESRFNDHLLGWSSDNSHLLFTSDRSGSVMLYAQQIVNGHPQGLPEALSSVPGRIATAGVTSDGALYYVPSRLREATDLRMAAIDFSTGRIVTTPTEVSGAHESDSAPDYSADGKFLAFVSSSAPFSPTDHNTLSLAVLALDSSQRTDIRVALTSASTLRWAPDGESLLTYGRGPATEPFGYWLINRRTGALSRIAAVEPHTPLSGPNPLFSSDSKTVYFRRTYNATKEIAYFAHDVVSGLDRELFRAAFDAQGTADPQGSPDARTIFYRRGIGGAPPFMQSALIARDVATGAERELIRRNLGGVNISRDGKYIVTGSNDEATQSRSLILIPTDGSASRELMRVALPSDFAAAKGIVNPLGVYMWAKDNQSLIVEKHFGSTKIERRELWWVPIDGHAPPALLDLPDADIRINPDNRRIAFVVPPPPAATTGSELHFLEHFLPSAK